MRFDSCGGFIHNGFYGENFHEEHYLPVIDGGGGCLCGARLARGERSCADGGLFAGGRYFDTRGVGENSPGFGGGSGDGGGGQLGFSGGQGGDHVAQTGGAGGDAIPAWLIVKSTTAGAFAGDTGDF